MMKSVGSWELEVGGLASHPASFVSGNLLDHIVRQEIVGSCVGSFANTTVL